jgi:hypothetical protein
LAIETTGSATTGGGRAASLDACDSKFARTVTPCLAGAIRERVPSAERVPSVPSIPAPLRACFNAEHIAPGHARRLTIIVLRGLGCDDALIDDVALTVSELASNAVRHAASPFSLSVRVQNTTVHVSVQDHAPLLTNVPNGGLTPRPLHGLGLIDAVAARWGVDGTHDGKIVWVELRAARDLPQATGSSTPGVVRLTSTVGADTGSEAGVLTTSGHGGPGRLR